MKTLNVLIAPVSLDMLKLKFLGLSITSTNNWSLFQKKETKEYVWLVASTSHKDMVLELPVKMMPDFQKLSASRIVNVHELNYLEKVLQVPEETLVGIDNSLFILHSENGIQNLVMEE